jgi:hypothetical protein
MAQRRKGTSPMQNALIVKGRLTGPRSVELDEPVSRVTDEVQVILQRVGSNGPRGESVFEFLRSLPPGIRSKEDIDRQIREERDSWGDR